MRMKNEMTAFERMQWFFRTLGLDAEWLEIALACELAYQGKPVQATAALETVVRKRRTIEGAMHFPLFLLQEECLRCAIAAHRKVTQRCWQSFKALSHLVAEARHA